MLCLNHCVVATYPADTKRKITFEPWSEWQKKPIPEVLHNEWKAKRAFNKGMAVILGKIWHRQDKIGYYLIGVDADNRKAIEEICTRNGKTIRLEEFANDTLVEWHKDNPDKAHVYFYSPRPFAKKSSDVCNDDMQPNIETLSNKIPAFEVKALGEHGIMFCTPSLHKNGQPYAESTDNEWNRLGKHIQHSFCCARVIM